MSTQKLPQGVLPDTISLVFGHPDATTLPVDELRVATETVLGSPQACTALQYGSVQGSPALIDYVVDKLNREESLGLTQDNLLIVAGSTHALDMIARQHARCGGTVLVEAPTYHDALRVFRDHDADLHPMAIDENGIIVDELGVQLAALVHEGKSPRLLYTIPTFQNPSGVTITQSRREKIIELSREYGFVIVEDDVYRDLAFEGDVPPSFYGLTGGDTVLRIGSFSKIVAPGLRLGWLIAAPEQIKQYLECGTIQMGGGANPFVAHIMAEYCRSGNLESHVTRLRQVYCSRCNVMLAALERHMPRGVTWTRPRGGFFVWLTLPIGLHVRSLGEASRSQGVHFAPGTGFFAGSGGERNLRLAFSFVPSNEIDRGVRILAQIIREMMPQTD
jgi:2-aminoadipate transaminase